MYIYEHVSRTCMEAYLTLPLQRLRECIRFQIVNQCTIISYIKVGNIKLFINPPSEIMCTFPTAVGSVSIHVHCTYDRSEFTPRWFSCGRRGRASCPTSLNSSSKKCLVVQKMALCGRMGQSRVEWSCSVKSSHGAAFQRYARVEDTDNV